MDQEVFEQTLKHSKPLESTTDSETTSAQFSSSEDLVVVGEIDPGYALVNILPLSGPSPVSACSQESEESGGYANPVDAVNLPSEVIQKRFSTGPGVGVLYDDKRKSGSGLSLNEAHHQTSPYQSVEDVRKMRELQNNQRQQLSRTSGKNRSHSVSPNASRTNLQQQLQQQQQQQLAQSQDEERNTVNYYDDNPGYSRPFDALSGTTRMKVSTENLLTKKAPTTAPPPLPAMRRTTSGDRPGKERSAKSLHKTVIMERELAERAAAGQSEDNSRNPVLKGGNKRSWKVGELINRANGSVTPPPSTAPVLPSDRPKPKEQWQLPRQKPAERMDKSYLRSRSDNSFQDEQQQQIKQQIAVPKVGNRPSTISSNDNPLFRGDTGRTASEGAMLRLKPKPPLMNTHQLKPKKPNPTKAM